MKVLLWYWRYDGLVYLFGIGFVSEGIFLFNNIMYYIYLVERNLDYGRVYLILVDMYFFINILRGLMLIF